MHQNGLRANFKIRVLERLLAFDSLWMVQANQQLDVRCHLQELNVLGCHNPSVHFFLFKSINDCIAGLSGLHTVQDKDDIAVHFCILVRG